MKYLAYLVLASFASCGADCRSAFRKDCDKRHGIVKNVNCSLSCQALPYAYTDSQGLVQSRLETHCQPVCDQVCEVPTAERP